MSTESGSGVGRWRFLAPAAAGRSPASRWATLTVITLAMLLIVVGVIATVLYFVSPAPRAQFTPYWIGSYQNPQVPPIPWTEADRKGLRDTEVFTWADPTGTSRPTKEVWKASLGELRRRRASEPLVVLLSTYAVVGEKGTVQLLTVDSNPAQPETLLPLADLLDALRDCPAKKKLLILDVMRPLNFPGFPALVNVADRAASEVRERNDGLLVLGACDAGQSPLSSEVLGRSVFHYFLQVGLGGNADLDRNGRLTVRELADFLRQNVNEWTQRNMAAPQRPFLAGPDDADFTLVMTSRTSPQHPTKRAEEIAKAHEAAAKAETQGKEAKVAPTGPESLYPKWLAEGWTVRDGWWKSGAFASVPRIFRRLEASLLRTEKLWREGGDPSVLRNALAGDIRSLRLDYDRAIAIPRPGIHSVGQAVAFGWHGDPELAAALKVTLRQRPAIDPAEKPEQRAAATTALVKGFADKLKGKTSLDLAGAIVAATAEERFDAETIRFLDRIVSESKLGRDLVELRFLNELAARTEASPAEWGGDEAPAAEETAHLAWNVVELAERANNQAESLAWVRDQLNQADARRELGQWLLRPPAAGLASWRQIRDVWQEARTAYERIDDVQRKVHDAQLASDQALATLPAYTDYLEAGSRPDLEDTWLELATRTREVQKQLAPPAGKPGESRAVRSSTDLNLLSAGGERIRQLLEALNEPFQGAAVDALAAKTSLVRPSPEAFRELDAILETPTLDAATRAKAWQAAWELAVRLDAEPPGPAETDGGTEDDASTREATIRRLATRRARRSIALLQLGGVNDTRLENPKTDQPGALGESILAAWWGLDSSGGPQAGWIAPAFVLDLDRNREAERMSREALANWAWLVGHYRHEARELGDRDKFYELAAIDGPRTARPPDDEAIEVLPQSPGAVPALFAEKPSADVSLEVLLHAEGGGEARDGEIRVLTPSDDRLRISFPNLPVPSGEARPPFGPPVAIKLAPQVPTPVSVRIEWAEDQGDDRPPSRPPSGLALEVRVKGGRAYHAIVPLNILQERDRPRLILSDRAGYPNQEPFELRLRSGIGRAPHYLFVRNPSTTARALAVEIGTGDALVPGGKAAINVPAGATAKVVAFGAPVLKPTDPLPELTGPLSVRLIDPATGTIVDQRTLRADIALPYEYILVADARYTPAHGEKPNQLSVILKALPEMTGPPCPVELGLSKLLIPSLRTLPTDTRLSGKLEPGGSVTLIARDLPLDPAQRPEGEFVIDVDGQKRALWYRTTFSRTGGAQVPVPDTQPKVRFEPTPVVQADQPAKLRIRFFVDNAPSEAKLEFRILGVGEESSPDDIPRWLGDAKQRHIGFDARGGEGALLFEASSVDWVKEFETQSIRGTRLLRARLLDGSGREIASYESPLVFDDVPPQDVALASVPLAIKKGTPVLAAKATVTPPVSGVKQVDFFVGKPADFEKAKAGSLSAKGEPTGSAGMRVWGAKLVLPPTLSGTFSVSVRVVSGAGLASFDTAEVDVAEPKPDLAAFEASLPKEPGTIEGTVVQGDLPQPNLDVVLRDEKGAEVGRTKTGKDGKYLFEKVKPGKYQVSSANEASRTTGSAAVTVDSGKAVAVKPLDLFR